MMFCLHGWINKKLGPRAQTGKSVCFWMFFVSLGKLSVLFCLILVILCLFLIVSCVFVISYSVLVVILYPVFAIFLSLWSFVSIFGHIFSLWDKLVSILVHFCLFLVLLFCLFAFKACDQTRNINIHFIQRLRFQLTSQASKPVSCRPIQ